MLRSTGADTSATFRAVDGTSHSVELLLSVDRDGPHTLGAQIEEQLRCAIRDRRAAARGAGPVDARPRWAARDLAAGRGRGLRPTRRRGLPEPAPGRAPTRFGHRGSRVRGAATPRARRRASLRLPPERPRRLGVPARGLAALAARGDREPHRRRARLRRSVRRRRAAPPARRYLGRARGVVADPDRVVVTNGYGQGQGLVCQALAGAGATRIAMEDPSDPEQHEIAARAGLDPVRVPVDGDGIRVDDLGRRRRGDRHPGAPASDRRRARPRAPHGAAAMAARPRRARDRGRLRRRVPLRPRRRRRAAGPRAGADRLRRLGEQDAGAGAAPRLARRARRTCSSR